MIKSRPVIWNNLNKKKPYPLPEGVTPVSKYVKGPKEIQLFLSQVGIVNNEDGNKYQKRFKAWSIISFKNGELWRWDGLNIKDGSKTITYKRIISTTKLIGLEKELNEETIKINKLKEIRNILIKS